MKCPHCDYDSRPETVEGTTTRYRDGEHGNMFHFEQQGERSVPKYMTGSGYKYEQHVQLYGCPVCMKTFIAED